MRTRWLLLFVLFIPLGLAGQTTMDLPDVQKPHQIAVDGNDLYIFDEADYSLHAYTISPFAPKWRIGRKGDGPSDFKYLPLVSVRPEGLTCADFTKILWFSKTGELLKIKPFSEFADFDINSEMLLVPVKEKFLRITADHEQKKRHVYLLDSGLEILKELYEGPFIWRADAPVQYRTDTICSEGLIFVSDTQKGFTIMVFDEQGKPLRTIDISREVEKIGDRPLLHQFCVSDGKIYATTYKKKDSQTEMIVLDLDGRILKRLYLPLTSLRPGRGVLRFDLYTAAREKLYELVQNRETGKWELLITKLPD